MSVKYQSGHMKVCEYHFGNFYINYTKQNMKGGKCLLILDGFAGQKRLLTHSLVSINELNWWLNNKHTAWTHDPAATVLENLAKMKLIHVTKHQNKKITKQW